MDSFEMPDSAFFRKYRAEGMAKGPDAKTDRKPSLRELKVLKMEDRGWIVMIEPSQVGDVTVFASAHTTKADLLSWLSRELEDD